MNVIKIFKNNSQRPIVEFNDLKLLCNKQFQLLNCTKSCETVFLLQMMCAWQQANLLKKVVQNKYFVHILHLSVTYFQRMIDWLKKPFWLPDLNNWKIQMIMILWSLLSDSASSILVPKVLFFFNSYHLKRRVLQKLT